jgi:replicative DNA helicase
MVTKPVSPKPTPPGTTESKTPTRPTGKANLSGALERLLPQDIDAERATLGSMLMEPEAIGEVIRELRDAGADAFSRENHQQLFDVLIEFYRENTPIDGKLIAQALERRGLWDRLGQYDFLGSLVSAVPAASRVRHYAQIVYEKHLLRQLIDATHRVTETALDDRLPAAEILDIAEKEIFTVTERRVTGEAQALPELVEEAFKIIERREGLTGEPTGFYELDEITCGLQPGELIIIAGRPSMGKTAFGLNCAEHLAIKERRPVLFFSLEMSRLQLAQRVLCSRARVNSHRLRRGRHTDEDMGRLQAAASELSRAPLLIDDTSDLSILELRARARLAHRRHQIRAVFVDYLQLMRSPRSESRQVEVATISRGLKALAKDLGIPVVAMAQLNRNPEDKSRRGNRPRMSDLRESGAIEQDADLIALLHREAYYKAKSASGELGDAEPADAETQAAVDPEDNIAELIIDKQRNGPVGKIVLHWNREFTRFDNHLPGGPRRDFTPPPPAGDPF